MGRGKAGLCLSFSEPGRFMTSCGFYLTVFFICDDPGWLCLMKLKGTFFLFYLKLKVTLMRLVLSNARVSPCHPLACRDM